MKSDCRKLHSIGHYKPTNLRAVWSKSENITKRMEAHFTCMPETSQLGWFLTLGTKQKNSFRYILADPKRSDDCICLLLWLSAPHPQSQSPVSWALARSHGRAPEVNPPSSKSICWNPRFQHFSIGTHSQNPSRTGASAKLSCLCIHMHTSSQVEALPDPQAAPCTPKFGRSAEWPLSHDVWLPGFICFMLKYAKLKRQVWLPKACCPPHAAASHRWILFAAPSCEKTGVCLV